MGIYETELGYKVTEFNGGLDVTEDGEFVCELIGKTLNDYRTDKDDEDSDIDDDLLEADIKEQVEVFLDNGRNLLKKNIKFVLKNLVVSKNFRIFAS